MGKKRSISDDNGGISTAKRTKTTVSSSSKRTGPQPKTDSNGDIYWEISRMRRVTISNFKGRNMVNIREYYEKDGEELPGKKVRQSPRPYTLRGGRGWRADERL